MCCLGERTGRSGYGHWGDGRLFTCVCPGKGRSGARSGTSCLAMPLRVDASKTPTTTPGVRGGRAMTVLQRVVQKKSRWPITLPSGRAVRPKDGRYWAFSKETFEKARGDGRVWFGRNGDSMPVIKRYLSDVQKGVAPKTWWPATDAGSNQEAKRDHLNKLLRGVPPFETPKPERLLERILHIGTDPGDLVIDCFLGSGTTAAAAHKMGRRWIGIERSAETLDKYAIPRLTKVIHGDDPMGITEQTAWEGGGGCRLLDVAPSMFAADGGVVVLADWATNGKLAEATAAQLGFEFESDPPFTGRKGRTRLAVIDGLISTDVVELIASALGEDERAVVCGTAVDPAAGKALRRLRTGSSVRKIPASILDEYRQARWTPRSPPKRPTPETARRPMLPTGIHRPRQRQARRER